MRFDVDEFVAECRAVRGMEDAPERIASLVRDAIAAPEAIAATVRERQAAKGSTAMAELFLNEDDLTIYQVSFPPNLFGVPHDHAGWAVIGVYAGAEGFNIYEEAEDGLRRIGRQVLSAPAVAILPADLIHDIDNAGADASGSIHIYGNRHFDLPGRRIWRDETADAEPFTVQRSFDYGMALTRRRRQELGIEESSVPGLPPIPSPRRR